MTLALNSVNIFGRWSSRIAVVAVAWVCAWPSGWAQTPFIDEVHRLAANASFGQAEALIGEYERVRGVTPELTLAESWLARGMLDAGSLDDAEKHAAQTETWALQDLSHFGAKSSGDADALALSASIEVRAQVLARHGQRSEAVAYLKSELEKWGASPALTTRIQKNLNLLTLEGHVAPAIDVAHWIGEVKPVPLSELRGHPVLLFFWAHWCPDCKAMAPDMEKVYAAFEPKGLRIVAPTMEYGYAAQGQAATPAQEDGWITRVWNDYYARIGKIAIPVSQKALDAYGVSTTPTIVLVDRKGVVRLYHPGRMGFAELSAKISAVL